VRAGTTLGRAGKSLALILAEICVLASRLIPSEMTKADRISLRAFGRRRLLRHEKEREHLKAV